MDSCKSRISFNLGKAMPMMIAIKRETSLGESKKMFAMHAIGVIAIESSKKTEVAVEAIAMHAIETLKLK